MKYNYKEFLDIYLKTNQDSITIDTVNTAEYLYTQALIWEGMLDSQFGPTTQENKVFKVEFLMKILEYIKLQDVELFTKVIGMCIVLFELAPEDPVKIDDEQEVK